MASRNVSNSRPGRSNGANAQRGPAKGDSWSSMVLSGDRIYILNQSGDCVVLRASPKFELLAANSIGNELTNSSIVPSDGEIFIRTHKHLWCIAEGVKAASR